MELPFLKNKQKPGVVVGTVGALDPLLEGIAEDFLVAVEKRDLRRLREALQALVLNTKDHDEAQDG